MVSAKNIAQDVLDRHGSATASGDVEATLGWFDLPCILESREGQLTVGTGDEMRAICVAFIDHLKSARVTHFVRQCLEADFKDENTIRAAYETRFVRAGYLLTDEPYAGFLILRRRHEGWKIGMIQISATGNNLANQAMRKPFADGRDR